MPRYKGRSSRVLKKVAFRTFGEIRPLMSKWVLPVYDDPLAPPFEIVCDTRDVAIAHKERLVEADPEAFEQSVDANGA